MTASDFHRTFRVISGRNVGKPVYNKTKIMDYGPIQDGRRITELGKGIKRERQCSLYFEALNFFSWPELHSSSQSKYSRCKAGGGMCDLVQGFINGTKDGPARSTWGRSFIRDQPRYHPFILILKHSRNKNGMMGRRHVSGEQSSQSIVPSFFLCASSRYFLSDGAIVGDLPLSLRELSLVLALQEWLAKQLARSTDISCRQNCRAHPSSAAVQWQAYASTYLSRLDFAPIIKRTSTSPYRLQATWYLATNPSPYPAAERHTLVSPCKFGVAASDLNFLPNESSQPTFQPSSQIAMEVRTCGRCYADSFLHMVGGKLVTLTVMFEVPQTDPLNGHALFLSHGSEWIVKLSNHLWALVGDPSSRRTNTRQQQQSSGRPDLASREGRKPIPVVSADDASLLMKRRSYISAPERQRQ
ncbi:hypothetical protein BDFG_07056 [Blastomyces dermatitidis ATCC 26199]|nr:hypothetical protein BDFG_07056 [Blastomyces dermatitidis ATCC 26199]